jgi:hypothetical protein
MDSRTLTGVCVKYLNALKETVQFMIIIKRDAYKTDLGQATLPRPGLRPNNLPSSLVMPMDSVMPEK